MILYTTKFLHNITTCRLGYSSHQGLSEFLIYQNHVQPAPIYRLVLHLKEKLLSLDSPFYQKIESGNYNNRFHTD